MKKNLSIIALCGVVVVLGGLLVWWTYLQTPSITFHFAGAVEQSPPGTKIEIETSKGKVSGTVKNDEPFRLSFYGKGERFIVRLTYDPTKVPDVPDLAVTEWRNAPVLVFRPRTEAKRGLHARFSFWTCDPPNPLPVLSLYEGKERFIRHLEDVGAFSQPLPNCEATRYGFAVAGANTKGGNR